MLRNIFSIAYIWRKKSEKEKQNNNNVWNDDEKDNRATCKTCTNKLPNNSDNSLCTTCLFVKIHPQPVVERTVTISERLRFHRKSSYDRENDVLNQIEKGDDEQVIDDDDEESSSKKVNKQSKDKINDDEEESEESEDDSDDDDDDDE